MAKFQNLSQHPNLAHFVKALNHVVFCKGPSDVLHKKYYPDIVPNPFVDIILGPKE
jgi:hypothetical protein